MQHINRILIAVLIICTCHLSYGAFPVRKTSFPTEQTTAPAPDLSAKAARIKSHSSRVFTRIADALSRYAQPFSPVKKKTDIHGTLSLVFGIGSLVLFPGFCFPAVILAVIGLQRHERYSVAGLILGIVGFIFLTVLLLAILVLG